MITTSSSPFGDLALTIAGNPIALVAAVAVTPFRKLRRGAGDGWVCEFLSMANKTPQ
jgi:hypothetical protein